jgi:hypothetical protein
MTSGNTNLSTSTKLLVNSLKASVHFSEYCLPLSVDAQRCAMYSEKEIAVGTPVVLRLETGAEATGQIVFCKASPSNNKLWSLGAILDKPESLRELNPRGKASAAGNPSPVISADKIGISASIARVPESDRIADSILSEPDTTDTKPLEKMRQEMDAIVTDAQAKFGEEVQAQRKNTLHSEVLLQEAAAIRESLTSIHQSLWEKLDRKIADGVDNALQQIEVRMSTLMGQAQSESEKLEQQLRFAGNEIHVLVHQSVSAALERSQCQLSEVASKHSLDRRKEISDATRLLGQDSDQIFSAVRNRLEKEFAEKQEIITSIQNELAIEGGRFQAQVRNVDDRIAKSEGLAIQVEADFSSRLDGIVSERFTQARTGMELLLAQIRNEQLGQASKEVETTLAPVFTRVDFSAKSLRSLVDLLSRERDETEIQISAVRQEKEGMQLWLAQQSKDFRKTLEGALFDAGIQGRTSVQRALDMIQNPVDKLTSEAKIKIEELTARQHLELGEATRRLRDELVTLQKRAEDSLRASFHGLDEASNEIPRSNPTPTVLGESSCLNLSNRIED